MFTFPRKTCFLIFSLAFLFALPAITQPVWEWAVSGSSAGSFDSVYGRGVAADSQGNIYVAGKFSGTATFSNTNSPVVSFGDSDAFLAKYNNHGLLQWVKQFGGTGFDEANAVAVDTNGFVYVAGRHGGPGVFGSFTLTNAGFATGFTLKFDPATTNVLWATESGLEWWGVAADASGNCYVVGDPLGLQIAGSKLAGPIALAKYNSTGVRQWYTNSPSANLFTGVPQKLSLWIPMATSYITGFFSSTSNQFGGTTLTNAPVENNTRSEIFVAKFNSRRRAAMGTARRRRRRRPGLGYRRGRIR